MPRVSVTPAPGGVPEWPIGTALKAVAGSNVSRGFESRPLCVSTYRLDRGVALMTVGICLVVAAVATFLAFMLMPLDTVVRFIGYAAGAVAALAIVVASHYAFRPPVVLRLDDDGYHSRARATRASGPFTGRWLDVEDVTVTGDVLRVTLADGVEQRLPLEFFGRDRLRVLREFHDRLNSAHGYRRFEV